MRILIVLLLCAPLPFAYLYQKVEGRYETIASQCVQYNPGYALECGYQCNKERRADKRKLDRLIQRITSHGRT